MNTKDTMDAWRKYLKEGVMNSDVVSAFQNTDPSYLEASLKQRNPGPGRQRYHGAPGKPRLR